MEHESKERRPRDDPRMRHRRSSEKPRDPWDASRTRQRRSSEEPRDPWDAPRTRHRRSSEEPRNSRAAQEAQRRREERKERDSRAAQEAQRRREERKERERLDHLRQKQKRKAKHRTKKRISAETWRRLLIMGGIVIAVVLSMVIFFRVQSVEVVGNSYYSAEEIIQAAGVSEGDNLLIVSRGAVAGNIMAELPYINTVRVTHKLPNKIVVTVTEFDATYAVTDTEGAYYLITANGKATEKVEQREAKSHILIQELTIETPTIGEIVQVHADEGEEVAAQEKFNALTKLLTQLEEAELSKQIVSVSVPSSFQLTVNYEDRFQVDFGNSERLYEKFAFLKTVIAQQKDYAKGTIDLTRLSEGDSKEVHVILGE